MDILLFVAGSGVVGFMLFLLGYSAFAIVKNGKLKRAKKEAQIRAIENIKLENYLQNIDADLKAEIDAAANINSPSDNTSTSKQNQHLKSNNILSHSFMKIIEKGLNIVEKGMDMASHKIEIAIKEEQSSEENNSFQNKILSMIKE